jgi:eukaryotic-like serine/threonine-protein kinase
MVIAGSDSLLGRRVGNYVLKKAIGAGAMGTVFLAEHPHINRRVAVKIVSPEIATQPGLSDRFLAEARAVASISHPNVVEIYDFGDIDGRMYYSMEWLAGRDLRVVVEERQRFTAEELFPYLTQICAALEAAHAAKIVHRDLKPANIFILDRAPLTLKLIDFGIAKSPAGESRATRTGALLLGTPAYMAPEQAEAQNELICPQTDIYSLGVTLFRMLAGRLPFEAPSSLMLLVKVVRDAPPPLAELAPETPAAIAQLVARCLEKTPEQRPRSAAEVVCEFAAALGAPVPSALVAAAAAARARVTPMETGDLTIACEPALAAQTAGNSAVPASDETSAPQPSIDETVALQSLLRWMAQRGDFPAVSRAITDISTKARSEGEASASDLADAIMKDYSLTSKLLRLVQSAYYDRAGQGVNTVARAVMLLGFDKVRMVALSLTLFQNTGKKENAADLLDNAIGSILRGEIARRVAGGLELPTEEAFVCSMFRNVGRHMVQYYLPDQYRQVMQLVADKGLTEERASRSVLGLSFERISIGIARHWHLSDRLSTSMQTFPAGPIPRPSGDAARLQAVSAFADELAALVGSEPQPGLDRAEHVRALLKRYEVAVPMKEREANALVAAATKAFDDLYLQLFDDNARRGRVLRRFADWSGHELPTGERPSTLASTPSPSRTTPAVAASATPSDPAEPSPVLSEDACWSATCQRVEAAVQALRVATRLRDVYQLFVKEAREAFGFTRAMLLIMPPGQSQLEVRAGLGLGVESLVGQLRVPVGGTDLFTQALALGKDILVEDAATVERRLPRWYRESIAAPAFLLFPLMSEARLVGLFYADAKQSPLIQPRARTLLERLRDAVVATIERLR